MMALALGSNIIAGSGADNIINSSFFGQSMYSPTDPENASWLKSDGQWHSGKMYKGMYEWLLTKRAEQEVYMYGYDGTPSSIFWLRTNNPKVGDTVYGHNPKRPEGKITSVQGDTFTFSFTSPGTGEPGLTYTCSPNSARDGNFLILPSNYVADNTLDLTPKVILKSETTLSYMGTYVNDYDFIIDEENESFRLPLLDGSESITWHNVQIIEPIPASGTSYYAPSNGIYHVLSFSTGENPMLLLGKDDIYKSNTPASSNWDRRSYARVPAGDFRTANAPVSRGEMVTLTYDNVEIRYFVFIPNKGNGDLYYYIGDTTQNENLIDFNNLKHEIELRINELKQQVEEVDSSSLKNTGTQNINGNLRIVTSSQAALSLWSKNIDSSIIAEQTEGENQLWFSDKNGAGYIVLQTHQNSDGIRLNFTGKGLNSLGWGTPLSLYYNKDGINYLTANGGCRASVLTSTTATDIPNIGQVNSRINQAMSNTLSVLYPINSEYSVPINPIATMSLESEDKCPLEEIIIDSKWEKNIINNKVVWKRIE